MPILWYCDKVTVKPCVCIYTMNIKSEENIMKLVIINERCPKNHQCPAMRVCPVNALSQNNFDAPIVDLEKCIRCGKCVQFCPKKALVLES